MSARVRLGLTLADASPLGALYVANAADFSGAARLPPGTALDWLLGGSDGEKTVYIKVVDAAGNEASASDTIGLDTLPPSLALALTGALTLLQGPTRHEGGQALVQEQDARGWVGIYLDRVEARIEGLEVRGLLDAAAMGL